MTGKRYRPKLIEPGMISLHGDGRIWVQTGTSFLVDRFAAPACAAGQPLCDACWQPLIEAFRSMAVLAEVGSFEATKVGVDELVKNLKTQIK